MPSRPEGTTPTIALDVGPVRAEPAGVGLYAGLLARALSAQLPGRLALIGVRPEAGLLRDLGGATPGRPLRTGGYHAWLQLHADRDARAAGADLAHYTNAAAPVLARLPYVLTVHDLSLMRMPGSHPVGRRLIVPVNLAAIARARTIIVPSRWTARELGRIGVSPRRVVVIAHAPTLDPAAADDSVVRRLGLEPGRYVLYVGTVEPRKNVERLIAAFELVARDEQELRLVLVGASGWLEKGIKRRIEGSSVRARIVRPGYLAAAEVSALVRDAAVFAYVSLYEGFGMPVLDALAFGTPVVTSRTSAMPEAAGGAAVLVDPREPADIARGISEATGRRDELRRLGLARASGREWADVASEHIAVYRHASRPSRR